MRTPLGGISVGYKVGITNVGTSVMTLVGLTVGWALGTFGALVRTPLGGISVGYKVGITSVGAPVRDGDSVLKSQGVVGRYVGTLGNMLLG